MGSELALGWKPYLLQVTVPWITGSLAPCPLWPAKTTPSHSQMSLENTQQEVPPFLENNCIDHQLHEYNWIWHYVSRMLWYNRKGLTLGNRLMQFTTLYWEKILAPMTSMVKFNICFFKRKIKHHHQQIKI